MNYVSDSDWVGKPVNLPYPPLSEGFNDPEIYSDMIDYYFERTIGDPPMPCTRIAVTSDRGYGKTRAAVEYAWSRADQYTALLFVSATSWWGFRDHVAFLCPVLGIQPESSNEDNRAHQVLQWLANPANAGWLLIVDDIQDDDCSRIVKDFINNIQGGHAIINFNIDCDDWRDIAQAFYLGTLLPEVARDYLLEQTGVKRKLRDDDQEKALELAKALKFEPLTMEMAAAYIGIHGLSLAEFLFRWLEMKPYVAEWVEPFYVQYAHNTAVVWQMSRDSLPAAALALLNMLVWLCSDPLPCFLVDRQSGSEDLQRNAAAFPSPNDILRKLSGDETADMGAALAVLRDYHFLEPARGNVYPSVGKIHQSIQLVTRQRLIQRGRQRDALQAAFDLVRGAICVDPYNPHTWSIWEPMIGHVYQIIMWIGAHEIPSPNSHLLNEFAQLMALKQRLPEAEDLMKRTLAMDEKLLGPNHPRLRPHLHNLSTLMIANGRGNEAEPLLWRLLDIIESQPGENLDMPLFNALSSLSKLLYDQGRGEEAEPLARRALALGEKILPPDDLRLANAMLTLVGLLLSVPQFPEAEPLLRRALAINEGHYGFEHPKIADLLNSLAILLQNTRRPAEAEMAMRRAIHIDEKALGPVHPNLARDLHCIAFYFQDEKRYAEAEPLIRRALDIEEKCFGPEHPKIATALNNLALVLAETKREDEAEPLMRQALAITEKAYGPIHEDVATSLNNLSQLIETRQPEEAEQMMRRQLVIFLTLSRISGHDHFLLKNAIGNYLKTLSAKPMDKKEFDQLIADLGPEAGFDQVSFLRLRKRIGL